VEAFLLLDLLLELGHLCQSLLLLLLKAGLQLSNLQQQGLHMQHSHKHNTKLL
jgi:hypothetical protein